MPLHSVSKRLSTNHHPFNQRYISLYSDSIQIKLFFSFAEGGADLEAIEVCEELVSTLDVSDQSHCQLLISLISDVHHGGDVYRRPIHP